MCSTSGLNGAEVAGGGNKRCREICQLLLQRSQLSGEALNLRPRRRHGRPRRVIGVSVGLGRGGGSGLGRDGRADGRKAEGTQDRTRVHHHPPRASPGRGPPSPRFPRLGGGRRAWARGRGWGRRAPDPERGRSAPGRGGGRAPARGRGRGLRRPLLGGNIERFVTRFIPREHQKGIGAREGGARDRRGTMNRGEAMYKIAGGSWRLPWGRHLAQLLLSWPPPSGVHGGRLVRVGEHPRVLARAAVVEGAVLPR